MTIEPFLRAPSALCWEHIFYEKWLLATSLREGHQWLDILTLNGKSVLDARVKTLKRRAIDIAERKMAENGISYIRDGG